ncbi:hypothetical protein [Wolbachia endosymbiont of Pentidionis agamae]|uniref:hypothetical protein n=1 Tax=Wolbachia endosymbiont of Pentidionis agamae TaxID=3110435 RepID=UPI002FD57CA6
MNRENIIKSATLAALGWIANSTVQLLSSYLKAGDHHNYVNINNAGSIPYSGGTIYIDSSQCDFSSVMPYITCSFLLGAAFVIVCGQNKHTATQSTQTSCSTQDVCVQTTQEQVNTKSTQTTDNVQDVGIQTISEHLTTR